MQKSYVHKHLEETDSTIRYMREEMPVAGHFLTFVTADYQTAGRGQGTNTWESERGKNLLCSIRVAPEALPANRQYVILQAAALAVLDTLSEYTDGLTIKWPNDIYWRDRKISGTLTECTISHGMVTSCIIGIGVDINQERFTSDAPNPISLCSIIGRQASIMHIGTAILWRIGFFFVHHINEGRLHHIHDLYLQSLYRREGLHPFRDADGPFTASIETVEPDGHLLLRRTDGRLSRHAFKEVQFVIAPPTSPITSHRIISTIK